MLNIDEFNLVNYFSMSREKAWYISTYLHCPVLLWIKSCPYIHYYRNFNPTLFWAGWICNICPLGFNKPNSTAFMKCNHLLCNVCQLFDSVYLQVISRGVSSYREMIRAMGSLSGEITQCTWSPSKQVI